MGFGRANGTNRADRTNTIVLGLHREVGTQVPGVLVLRKSCVVLEDGFRIAEVGGVVQ